MSAGRTVLEVATTPRRSGKRAGQSFEDVIEAAIAGDPTICLARAHPETKMIPDRRGGWKLVYTKKNGVDFVGSVRGTAVAIEAKRLPDAASLAGSKDDSTVAEAQFLVRFARSGGVGAFVVYDPDRATLYVVGGPAVAQVAAGGRVALRDRAGTPLVPCHSAVLPATLVANVRRVLADAAARWMAR